MPFTARLTGPCEDCDHGIREGDRIESIGDTHRYRHLTCPPPAPAPSVCPSCFQVPAASGACGCE